MCDVNDICAVSAAVNKTLNVAAILMEMESNMDSYIRTAAFDGEYEAFYFDARDLVDVNGSGHFLSDNQKESLTNELLQDLRERYAASGFQAEVTTGRGYPKGVNVPCLKVSWKKYDRFHKRDPQDV